MDYEERRKYASDIYSKNATKTEERVSRSSGNRRAPTRTKSRKNSVKMPNRDYSAIPSMNDEMMENEQIRRNRRPSNKKQKKSVGGMIISGIGKILATISVTILTIFLTLVMMLFLICHGPSEKATELFATTFLETGQMKFIVSIFLSNNRIQEIVAKNSMSEMKAEVDTNLIQIDESAIDNSTQEDIELVQISGNTFFAKMLIIKDPSRVKIATTYP